MCVRVFVYVSVCVRMCVMLKLGIRKSDPHKNDISKV